MRRLFSYNPNAGGGPPADGTVSSAKLGGDVTDAGKSILTAANKAAQRAWLEMAVADVSGLQTALDAKAGSTHTHAQSDVTGLVTALSGKANTSHTHAIADVTGLQTALDGKQNVGGGSGHWTTVTQTSDATVNNSTNFQNSSLTFSVAANTKYHFRGVAFIDTGATADAKIQFTGPASPTVLRVHTATINAAATAYGNIRVETAYSQSRALAGTGTNGVYLEFVGVLHNGANAGSLMVQWGANALEAVNTILRAGSYIEYSTV